MFTDVLLLTTAGKQGSNFNPCIRPERDLYTGAVKILAGALTLLTLSLTASPAAAEWRRLDSPNFIVIGDAGERELRNIAVQFEGFRETLGRVLSTKVTATPVPTVVVVFPHDRAYTPYKPVYNGKPVDVGGVFYSSRDANYITLLREPTDEGLRVLFHEYAHLMVSNVITNLPTWLDEGLAEYYSTYSHTRGGREAMIGMPIESHVLRLREGRLLPMSELIAVDQDSPFYNEGERRSLFYAQSWAITHMLLVAQPTRVKELSAFIDAIRRGTPAGEAWRQAFGGADIDKELRRYIQRDRFGVYPFKFDEAVARVEALARPMPQSEVSAFLAGLRLRQERIEEAATLVDAALKSDSAHAHVNVAKAQVDLARGDHGAAAARLTSIASTEDWFISYTAGTTLTDSLDRETDVPADRVDAARAHFAAVGKVRELANALADLARLDVVGRNRPTAQSRVTIERARVLAPGRDDYAITHAHILIELGDFALARAVLGPLLSPTAPPHARTNATSLMEYLQRVEARRQANEKSRTPAAAFQESSPSPAARATTASPEASAVTSTTRAVFRVTEAGEQRVEGTLERISCKVGAAVTFHVRTTAGAEVFQAAKFEAVDFITYRDDLPDTITCGPQVALPVYVTWRPGASGVRTVIAVEVLPK